MTSPLGQFLDELRGSFQQGYQFRTGIGDRKRRIATEDDTAQYEKARRLREDVAFGLQQRVGESNMATAEALTAYKTMFPTQAPYVQDWQKEGFKTQPAWQEYHKTISRAGQPKAADEKLQFAISGGIEAIKGILEHHKADPTSIRTPVGAQWAEGLASIHVPGFGSPFEGLAESSRQHAMTPGQSEVADLYEALAHNTAGILPNKGLAIFKSLRDVYRSKAGSSPETDQFKITLLERLQRRLEQLQRGEKVTDADFESDVNGASGANPAPNLLRRSTDQPPPPKKRADPSRFYTP